MSKAELEWISTHQREVEQNAGRWIALDANIGILASGRSPKEVLELSKQRHSGRVSLFKVPRKDEDLCILSISLITPK